MSDILYNNYDRYRLSDMLRWPQIRNGKCIVKKYKCEYDRYIHEFPNSIVTKYMLKLSENEKKKEGIELNKLHEVISSFPKEESDDKAIYIHLRIGDVCIADNDIRFNRLMSPQELCYHGLLLKYGNRDKYYCMPWCHYEKKIKEFLIKGAKKKIIIVAGMHTIGRGVKESNELLRLYKLQLEKMNYEVELRLGKNPDLDFVLLCGVRNFIEGGGGYGELIKECREWKKLIFK
jgi:hypothetical protein